MGAVGNVEIERKFLVAGDGYKRLAAAAAYGRDTSAASPVAR